MKKTVVLLLCIGAILFWGCAKKSSPDVAVKVDGEEITKPQIMRIAEMFREQYARFQPGSALQGITPDILKGAARQLIANQVLLREAKRRGLKVDSLKVNQTLAQFKARAGDAAGFQRQLTAMGETEVSVRKQISEGTVLDSLLKMVVAKSDSATLKECQDFFDKNKDKYVNPPQVHVSQMIFPVDSSKAPAVKKAILDKANKALAEVHSGKEIEVVAKKYSGNGAVGGDMGWVKAGDLRPDLQRVVDTLKPNEASSLITTNAGYIIIKKTGEKPGEAVPFEKVQANIKMNLNIKKRNALVVSFVDGLIAKANVVYVDTSYKPLPQLTAAQP